MANIVTGDETWVYFFEPHRKAANKIWAVTHLKWPCIARKVQSAKKVLCAIFLVICSSYCCSKGTRNHWQVYQKLCSKNMKSYYIKRRPKNGFKNIGLLHDNAPAHKSKIVTEFTGLRESLYCLVLRIHQTLLPVTFFFFKSYKTTGRKEIYIQTECRTCSISVYEGYYNWGLWKCL